MYLLGLFNTGVSLLFLKTFIAHGWITRVSDSQKMRLVMPVPGQERRLLVQRAIEAKRPTFSHAVSSSKVAAYLRPRSMTWPRPTGMRWPNIGSQPPPPPAWPSSNWLSTGRPNNSVASKRWPV